MTFTRGAMYKNRLYGKLHHEKEKIEDVDNLKF
jgi:hypothetical protein